MQTIFFYKFRDRDVGDGGGGITLQNHLAQKVQERMKQMCGVSVVGGSNKMYKNLETCFCESH